MLPQQIGPQRLKRLLLDQRVDIDTLPVADQLWVHIAVARLLFRPPAGVPKRALSRCGARCRDGHRCRAKAVWDADRDAPRNGRCRLHGGLSTGPKTSEGRRRIGAAARQRAQARREAQTQAHRRAEALQAWENAVQDHEAARQRASTRRHWLDTGLLTVKWQQVERAYEQCRACGVDPRA